MASKKIMPIPQRPSGGVRPPDIPGQNPRTRLGIKDPTTGAALGAELDDLLATQNRRAQEMAETLLGVRERAAKGDHALAMDAWGKQSAWSAQQGDKDRALQYASLNQSSGQLNADRAIKERMMSQQLADQRSNDAFGRDMMNKQMREGRLAERNAGFARASAAQLQSIENRNAIMQQRIAQREDNRLRSKLARMDRANALSQIAAQERGNVRSIEEQAAQRLSNERMSMNASSLQQMQWDRESASNRRSNLMNFASGLYR